jgi:phospholipase C
MNNINRRSFLKSATALAGLLWCPALLDSVRAAVQIDPAPGSTFLDAEHIVFLMQENRSFDHAFGCLQGVRGFNDPRTIRLPDGHPVWLQRDSQGVTYAPFHLDIHNTSSTHAGGLPHSWRDQVQARNQGKYDQWVVAKRPKSDRLQDLPLTLGYHTRADIPFYYALADAFTVCDQHFSSSLTGTTPNRLHFWSGTLRSEQTPEGKANVYNSDADLHKEAHWTTFPERLSQHDISWKVYQNEITVPTGLTSEEQKLLGNFEDNPLEFFSQYNVRFSPEHFRHNQQLVAKLPATIQALTQQLSANSGDSKTKAKLTRDLESAKQRLETARMDLEKWDPKKFEHLSKAAQDIHKRAFTTNKDDPDYHSVTQIQYQTADGQKPISVPKGDIFHQFRKDAATGTLPTVSWLVAPQQFSDHPSAPWNGAWYVSETLKILTQNPELWKKTIFILNYDENDGYFDHIPPFVAPEPDRPESGGCTPGLDTSCEFGPSKSGEPANPIGLGYRVPMIVASPWSRGGWVNSQVFDLTSPIRFLETFLSKKIGKPIFETNITSWRRAICGDMTSIFRPWNGESFAPPEFLQRDSFMTSIAEAKGKPLPNPGLPLNNEEIALIQSNPAQSSRFPKQEPGTRPSCAIPYELRSDCAVSASRDALILTFEARTSRFGTAALGAPFQVYASGQIPQSANFVPIRNYSVAAGHSLDGQWTFSEFKDSNVHLNVYGPNGFFREFCATPSDPDLRISCEPSASGKELLLKVENRDPLQPCELELTHNAYGYPSHAQIVPSINTQNQPITISLPLERSGGWYDFSIHIPGAPKFKRRFAGRIEDGTPSLSDPLMGKVLSV